MVDTGALAGLTIGITAERRAEEQARLFRTRGAATLHGPTLAISSRGADEELRRTTLELIRHPPHYLLASTGYGMRTWVEAAAGWGLREALLGALASSRVANRGAKAASANGAFGLAQWWRAPHERFDELVDAVLAQPLAGTLVVLQLHGTALPGATARLQEAGATVVAVDAYRASLPDDPGPARALIEAACAGDLAAVTFTTAPAVHNLFTLAEGVGRAGDLRRALNGPVVAACVGPVCATGAVDEGVTDPLVPPTSRLVPLVHALTRRLGGPEAGGEDG
ncbi:MAG: uroporphyrinogen-III synthase [Actinomycetota bacterium]